LGDAGERPESQSRLRMILNTEKSASYGIQGAVGEPLPIRGVQASKSARSSHFRQSGPGPSAPAPGKNLEVRPWRKGLRSSPKGHQKF
jgi:hypothetical protein